MSENTERRYLKWYNKVGYGSGDVAGNVVYAFLSSFVMIYLTDTVGLNPGIVGTLIAVSKLFDGLTDVFFGSMIDKTHSKLGKARPWMLYGYIGCAITLVGIFAIPMGMSEFAKYAWFFIRDLRKRRGFLMKTKNLKSDSRLKTLLRSFSAMIIQKTGIPKRSRNATAGIWLFPPI